MQIRAENQVDRYQILVGLNDKDSNLQQHDTEKYISVIEYYCKNNGMAFSIHTQRGGYVYESGAFAKENSLVITLIGASASQANELAAEVCALFNQESVLILHDSIGAYYISEQI